MSTGSVLRTSATPQLSVLPAYALHSRIAQRQERLLGLPAPRPLHIFCFRDAKNNIIAAFVQWKGLNGSGGGHAREGVVNDTFALAPDQLALFDHVDFRFGTKNCGFSMVGLHLKEGDKDNGVTFSTIECGNLPK